MKYFQFIILLTTLNSCGPRDAIDGYVIDVKTNRPILNAHIYEQDNPDNGTYTDSVGKFKVPATTVVVEKENYETKIITFDHCESEYISLKPIGQ